MQHVGSRLALFAYCLVVMGFAGATGFADGRSAVPYELRSAASVIEELRRAGSIELRRAAIDGPLDMTGLSLDGPVQLEACHFTGDVTVDGCRFARSLVFDGSTFEGDLRIERSSVEEELSLSGVEVAGRLRIGARSEDGTSSGQDSDDTSFAMRLGGVDLAAAKVSGTLYIEGCAIGGQRPRPGGDVEPGSRVESLGSHAVDARLLTCSSLQLRRVKTDGTVDFRAATIRHDAFIESVEAGARLPHDTNSELPDEVAFLADGASIGGSLAFSGGRFRGHMSLRQIAVARAILITAKSDAEALPPSQPPLFCDGSIALYEATAHRLTIRDIAIGGSLILDSVSIEDELGVNRVLLRHALLARGARSGATTGYWRITIDPTAELDAAALTDPALSTPFPRMDEAGLNASFADTRSIVVSAPQIVGTLDLKGIRGDHVMVSGLTMDGNTIDSVPSMPTRHCTGIDLALARIDSLMIQNLVCDGDVRLTDASIRGSVRLNDFRCRVIDIALARIGKHLSIGEFRQSFGMDCALLQGTATTIGGSLTCLGSTFSGTEDPSSSTGTAAGMIAVLLNNLDVGGSATMTACSAGGKVSLPDLRVGSGLILAMPTPAGRTFGIDGDLNLNTSKIAGHVLLDASVGGVLDMQFGAIGGTLDIGRMFFQDDPVAATFRCEGGVKIASLDVAGTLRVTGASLGGVGLDAYDLKVEDDLVIQRIDTPRVDLARSVVGGNILLGGGSLRPSASTAPTSPGEPGTVPATQLECQLGFLSISDCVAGEALSLRGVNAPEGLKAFRVRSGGPTGLFDVRTGESSFLLNGAVIGGGLTIEGLRTSELALSQASIHGSVGAGASATTTSPTIVRGLRFDRATVAGSIYLSDVEVSGWAYVAGTRIDGDLKIGGIFPGTPQIRLTDVLATNLDVGGMVSLRNTKITSTEPGRPAVDCRLGRIGGLESDHHVEVDGPLVLSYATIGATYLQRLTVNGLIDCAHARLGPFTISSDLQGECRIHGLNLFEASCESLWLSTRLAPDGLIGLEATTIDKGAVIVLATDEQSLGVPSRAPSVYAAGCSVGEVLRITSSREPTSRLAVLDLDRVTTRGSLDLGPLEIIGSVTMRAATIGENVGCTGLAIDSSLVATDATVEGIMFRFELPAARAGIDLRGARIRDLQVPLNPKLASVGDRCTDNTARIDVRGAQIERLTVHGRIADLPEGNLLDLRQSAITTPQISFEGSSTNAVVELLARHDVEIANREVYARFVEDRADRGLRREADAIWLAGQKRHRHQLLVLLLGYPFGFGLYWWVPLGTVFLVWTVLTLFFLNRAQSVDDAERNVQRTIAEEGISAEEARQQHGWSSSDAPFLALRYVVPLISLTGYEWIASSERVGERGFLRKIRFDTLAKAATVFGWIAWPLVIAGMLNIVRLPQPL